MLLINSCHFAKCALYTGVPESPFNVTVLETTSSFIFLMWLEPFDNNAPILRYTAILNDSSSGEVNAYIVEGKTEEANITDLKPFTEYSVRIIAENIIGQSPPSELQLVTTDEDGMYICLLKVCVYVLVAFCCNRK